VVATLLFGLQNFYLPAIGHLINTPMTFTGRTEIWNAVWRYIAAHPVLGAGYGSFWNIGPASPIFTYGFGWVQEVSEGHNGYLDLLAAIGPFGFLLVIAGAYVVPIVRLIGWRQSQRDTGALLMAMMIFIIGHNFTESSLFDRDTIGQVFLMLTIAGIWSVNPRSRSAESGGATCLAGPTATRKPALRRLSRRGGERKPCAFA
jgi:O-antigen ligase